MFDNIADKIKAFAKLICGLGITGCVLIGLIFLFDGNPLFAIIIAVAGSLSSYVFSIIMYGLGELIENSETIIFNSGKIQEEMRELTKEKQQKEEPQPQMPKAAIEEKKQETAHKWMCTCGNMISDPICPYCGANYEPPEQN